MSPSPVPRRATRTEHDALGPVQVDAEAPWGAQTQRAIEHFAIGGETMPPELLHALVLLKGVAAAVNGRLGELPADVADALDEAAAEVLAGAHPGAFPLSPWQSGSGTQTHMNVNEVLARLAGLRLGRAVHPNDEANRGQSSNDAVPSAMHLAVLQALRQRLDPALAALQHTLADHAARHAGVMKIGRTHLQDAVPLSAGDEAGAWASRLATATEALAHARPALLALAIGGTAVGSGLNTHPRFGAEVCAELARRTGLAFVPAADRFAALAGHEPLVALHGALKTLAVALASIANDLRLLASGPRSGLAEWTLPANEPGSSIMPGKVNPTQCEMVAMVAWQVIGNDTAVTLGAVAGHLQLNTAKPLIAANVLRSVRLLADATASFELHAVRGMAPDAERMRQWLEASLMRVTALVPHVGHDLAARIAQQAHRQHRTLREAALAFGIAADDFDRWTDPRPPGG